MFWVKSDIFGRSFWTSVKIDMQQSQCFGETHYGHAFFDHQPQIFVSSVGFGMLLGGFSVSQSIAYVIACGRGRGKGKGEVFDTG